MMAVACFGCLIGGVFLAVLPEDAATVGVTTDMDVKVGKSVIGRWMDEISDDLTEVNAQLSVNGDDFDPMGVELGGTLSWLYGKHIDISAGYNLEWRPDYLSHTLTATFRYSF